MSSPVAEGLNFDENINAPGIIAAHNIRPEDVISAQMIDTEAATVFGEPVVGTVVGIPEVIMGENDKPAKFLGSILLSGSPDAGTKVLPPSNFYNTSYTTFGHQITPTRYLFSLLERD